MTVEGSVNVHMNLVIEVPIVSSMFATDEAHAERMACADAYREVKQLLGDCKYGVPVIAVDEVVGGEFITADESAVIETEKVIYHGQLIKGLVQITRNMEPLIPDLGKMAGGCLGWGYNGTPTNQLAFAILLDVTGERETAERWHLTFAKEIISLFPLDTFILSNRTVHDWLAGKGVAV